MINLRTVRVNDANGVFLFNKFEVTDDNASTNFSEVRFSIPGSVADLGNTPGDDTIHAGGGNDTLDGGAGNDKLFGEAGNDLFVQKDLFGSDEFDGGSGSDKIDYSQAEGSGSGITARLFTGVIEKNPGAYDSISNIETLVGTRYDDVIHGGVMNGGIYSCTLDGGAGFDSLDYRQGLAADGTVNVNLGSGTVYKYIDGHQIGRDKVSNFESVTGTTGADIFTGGSGADALHGDDGNDNINGAAGNDRLFGDAGKDTISGGDGNDLFVQNTYDFGDTIDGGLGNDTVDYSQNTSSDVLISAAFWGDGSAIVDMTPGGRFVSPCVVDTLTGIETLIGTRNNDYFENNAGGRTMDGRGGNDFFVGGAGDDTLIGGEGNDEIRGNGGNDLFVQNSDIGSDTIRGGYGSDTIVYKLSSPAGFNVVVDFTAAHDGTVSKYQGQVLVGVDVFYDVEHIVDQNGVEILEAVVQHASESQITLIGDASGLFVI